MVQSERQSFCNQKLSVHTRIYMGQLLTLSWKCGAKIKILRLNKISSLRYLDNTVRFKQIKYIHLIGKCLIKTCIVLDLHFHPKRSTIYLLCFPSEGPSFQIKQTDMERISISAIFSYFLRLWSNIWDLGKLVEMFGSLSAIYCHICIDILRNLVAPLTTTKYWLKPSEMQK